MVTNMPQQQQSNMVKPQKVGGEKRPQGEVGKLVGKMMGSKMKIAKKKSLPSLKRVQNSVKKTMGY